jgi:hypothetical protein
MTHIDPHLLRLYTSDGFVQFYLELLCDYDTCQDAYEATERQHEITFGHRRYSDYDSFRVILSRYGKKKR